MEHEIVAKVGTTEAEKLTGKSRSTIHRAMNSGKLSYITDENGNKKIDVSELERVYGELQQNATSHDVARRTNDIPRNEVELLHVQLVAAQEKQKLIENRLWGFWHNARKSGLRNLLFKNIKLQ